MFQEWKLGWINGDVRINGLVISLTYKWRMVRINGL